jgi:cytoskeletal protein RodZ
MRTTTRRIVTVLGSLMFVAAVNLSAFAQAPAPRDPATQAPASQAPAGKTQKTQSAKGELKSVDTEKMTLTLANGQTFQYNDSTKVTGAQGGTAGLASMSGRNVTIAYEMRGADRVATAITIAAEKK